MANEADEVLNRLGQLDTMFNHNQDEVARALGLLLLGKKFDITKKEEALRDPTDYILNDPSLRLPKD